MPRSRYFDHCEKCDRKSNLRSGLCYSCLNSRKKNKRVKGFPSSVGENVSMKPNLKLEIEELRKNLDLEKKKNKVTFRTSTRRKAKIAELKNDMFKKNSIFSEERTVLLNRIQEQNSILRSTFQEISRLDIANKKNKKETVKLIELVKKESNSRKSVEIEREKLSKKLQYRKMISERQRKKSFYKEKVIDEERQKVSILSSTDMKNGREKRFEAKWRLISMMMSAGCSVRGVSNISKSVGRMTIFSGLVLDEKGMEYLDKARKIADRYQSAPTISKSVKMVRFVLDKFVQTIIKYQKSQNMISGQTDSSTKDHECIQNTIINVPIQLDKNMIDELKLKIIKIDEEIKKKKDLLGKLISNVENIFLEEKNVDVDELNESIRILEEKDDEYKENISRVNDVSNVNDISNVNDVSHVNDVQSVRNFKVKEGLIFEVSTLNSLQVNLKKTMDGRVIRTHTADSINNEISKLKKKKKFIEGCIEIGWDYKWYTCLSRSLGKKDGHSSARQIREELSENGFTFSIQILTSDSGGKDKVLARDLCEKTTLKCQLHKVNTSGHNFLKAVLRIPTSGFVSTNPTVRLIQRMCLKLRSMTKKGLSSLLLLSSNNLNTIFNLTADDDLSSLFDSFLSDFANSTKHGILTVVNEGSITRWEDFFNCCLLMLFLQERLMTIFNRSTESLEYSLTSMNNCSSFNEFYSFFLVPRNIFFLSVCSDFHISISSKQFSFLRTNGGKIAPDTFKWLKKWWKSYNGTEELYKDFVMKTIQDEVRILKKGDTTPSKIFSKDFIVKNRLTSSEQVESFFVKNFKLTQELLSTMQDSELSKHLKESFFEDLKNFLELTLELILEQVYELHCDENFLHVGCFTDDADKNLRRLSKLRNLYECGRKNLRDVVTGGLLETLKEQKGIWWKKISSNENSVKLFEFGILIRGLAIQGMPVESSFKSHKQIVHPNMSRFMRECSRKLKTDLPRWEILVENFAPFGGDLCNELWESSKKVVRNLDVRREEQISSINSLSAFILGGKLKKFKNDLKIKRKELKSRIHNLQEKMIKFGMLSEKEIFEEKATKYLRSSKKSVKNVGKTTEEIVNRWKNDGHHKNITLVDLQFIFKALESTKKKPKGSVAELTSQIIEHRNTKLVMSAQTLDQYNHLRLLNDDQILSEFQFGDMSDIIDNDFCEDLNGDTLNFVKGFKNPIVSDHITTSITGVKRKREKDGLIALELPETKRTKMIVDSDVNMDKISDENILKRRNYLWQLDINGISDMLFLFDRFCTHCRQQTVGIVIISSHDVSFCRNCFLEKLTTTQEDRTLPISEGYFVFDGSLQKVLKPPSRYDFIVPGDFSSELKSFVMKGLNDKYVELKTIRPKNNEEKSRYSPDTSARTPESVAHKMKKMFPLINLDSLFAKVRRIIERRGCNSYFVNEKGKFELYLDTNEKDFRKEYRGAPYEAAKEREKKILLRLDELRNIPSYKELFVNGMIALFDLETNGVNSILRSLGQCPMRVNGEFVKFNLTTERYSNFIISLSLFTLNGRKFCVDKINQSSIQNLTNSWFVKERMINHDDPKCFASAKYFFSTETSDELCEYEVLALMTYFLICNNVSKIIGSNIHAYDCRILGLSFVRYNNYSNLGFSSISRVKSFFSNELGIDFIDLKILFMLISKYSTGSMRYSVSYLLKIVNLNFVELHHSYYDCLDELFILLSIFNKSEFTEIMRTLIDLYEGKPWLQKWGKFKKEVELGYADVN